MKMFSVILLCVFCACVVLTMRRRIIEARAHRLPPVHPDWLPIIGHTHHLITDTKSLFSLVKLAADQCTQMGGVIHVYFGMDLYYLITDPDDALTALNSCSQKHFVYDYVKRWLGNGLITGVGEPYKRHRKLLHSGFSPPVVRGFLEVFNSQARNLVSRMQPFVGSGPFDPSSLIKNMALESACLTTFGSDIKDKNFIKNYMNAVDEMFYFTTLRFQKFYLQNNFIYKLTGYQEKEDLIIKTLNRLSNEVIQQKKIAMKDNSNHAKNTDFMSIQDVQYKPFLDLLLELSADGLLTDKEIIEEVDTNVTAAFETTTHTIENILVFLGSYPEVQEKVFQEVLQVVGVDKDLDKDDVPKLVYTKAVIKETLRMLPAAPVLPRYVDKDIKLKNYTMRANSQCLILTTGIHHHPAWGPDADQFRPERWLDPVSLPPLATHYAGFSLGKRACMGQTYALTQLPILLANLVRSYKWTADINKLEMKLNVTLKSDAGREISIQRRIIEGV